MSEHTCVAGELNKSTAVKEEKCLKYLAASFSLRAHTLTKDRDYLVCMKVIFLECHEKWRSI